VGWAMRQDARAELVVDALEMALWRRRPAPGLVHHSDRGAQDTSLEVVSGSRICQRYPLHKSGVNPRAEKESDMSRRNP
jgi:transposase InsO family protein